MEDDAREVAMQARDMASALFLALADRGIIPAGEAWAIFGEITRSLPQDLRTDLGHDLERYVPRP